MRTHHAYSARQPAARGSGAARPTRPTRPSDSRGRSGHHWCGSGAADGASRRPEQGESEVRRPRGVLDRHGAQRRSTDSQRPGLPDRALRPARAQRFPPTGHMESPRWGPGRHPMGRCHRRGAQFVRLPRRRAGGEVDRPRRHRPVGHPSVRGQRHLPGLRLVRHHLWRGGSRPSHSLRGPGRSGVQGRRASTPRPPSRSVRTAAAERDVRQPRDDLRRRGTARTVTNSRASPSPSSG